MAKYSCETAAETAEWMEAIAAFLRPLKPLLDAHVVNFFKDRLWELVDEEWMDYLRRESVENLLNLPAGIVQDYWPPSLREFVGTLRSLVLPREQELSHPILHDSHVRSLGSVLTQGMNLKKKHEVEVLAAVINKIAYGVRAHKIIDVGAGQGYLAQALAFHYHLSVLAIDASLHHANVTCARAERIKKHYAAKLRKSQLGKEYLKVPQTVTCHVLSSNTLTALSANSLDLKHVEALTVAENSPEINDFNHSKRNMETQHNLCSHVSPSLVLAGLHSCGDLSVNMLRSFIDCESVQAVVCIGCCYNLLSEDSHGMTSGSCGFPMSNAAKVIGLTLGKNSRDLACQSAERWRNLTRDAALQNFELHAFRAAFQKVLDKYYPETLKLNPSIGRRGKALRRQQSRRVLESHFGAKESINGAVSPKQECERETSLLVKECGDVEVINELCSSPDSEGSACTSSGSTDTSCCSDTGCKVTPSCAKSHKDALFEEFSKSGLDRLGLSLPEEINLSEFWQEVQPFMELVGPFWSLRASLGPLVETYILLDRLLSLQEQGESIQAYLLPLFHPAISPRNVAIVAQKTTPIHAPRL